MLSNEVFALQCRAKYEAQGLVVDATNGEFAHCPLPKGMGDKGYYLLWEDHQHQGLLQSKDLDKCCFFIGDAKKWLREHDDFSEDFSELWDIYWEYSGGAAHAAKDKNGKSLHGLRVAKRLHKQRDKNGKSVRALRWNEKLHSERNAEGKSVRALEHNNKLHAIKTTEGKSVVAVKAGKKTASQVWESTIDGFRSTAAGVACHNKARGWDPKARIRIS
jgi:hypothetical protein